MHSSYAVRLLVEKLGLAVTVLGERMGIDGATLAKIHRGVPGQKLTRKMVENVMGMEWIPDELKAEVVVAAAKDFLPEEAMELVMILPNAGRAGGAIAETPRVYGDKLTQALERLATEARANPALADSLVSLAKVVTPES